MSGRDREAGGTRRSADDGEVAARGQASENQRRGAAIGKRDAFTALVVPTFCVPNESEPGLSETRGLMAVAVNAAFCGLPAALSVTTSDAEAGPD